MSRKNQYVVPTDNGWGVRGEGNSRMSETFPTQCEAIARGRELLERLVAAHRSAVDSVSTHSLRVFDFVGERLR